MAAGSRPASRITFTATGRFSRVSKARKTSPMPPLPMRSRGDSDQKSLVARAYSPISRATFDMQLANFLALREVSPFADRAPGGTAQDVRL